MCHPIRLCCRSCPGLTWNFPWAIILDPLPLSLRDSQTCGRLESRKETLSGWWLKDTANVLWINLSRVIHWLTWKKEAWEFSYHWKTSVNWTSNMLKISSFSPLIYTFLVFSKALKSINNDVFHVIPWVSRWTYMRLNCSHNWPTDQSTTNWPIDQLTNWPNDQLTKWPIDLLHFLPIQLIESKERTFI